mmetsp:Transcript_40142/g.72723  ORF Transcript_40142/g.72723 Transcript_40142/m.72723 type:complete len:240 (-) Transcript_40142:367-1086(-)
MKPTIKDRGKSHGCEVMKRMESLLTITPDSSSTSRIKHSSRVSPNSTKPAKVEKRPFGQIDFLPSSARLPSDTKTMMEGSIRGLYRAPQSLHCRCSPLRCGEVFPPHKEQNLVDRCQSPRPRATASRQAKSSAVRASYRDLLDRPSRNGSQTASAPNTPAQLRSDASGAHCKCDTSKSQKDGAATSAPSMFRASSRRGPSVGAPRQASIAESLSLSTSMLISSDFSSTGRNFSGPEVVG